MEFNLTKDLPRLFAVRFPAKFCQHPLVAEYLRENGVPIPEDKDKGHITVYYGHKWAAKGLRDFLNKELHPKIEVRVTLGPDHRNVGVRS